MKQFTYRIEDENGMHARPAGMLANLAKRFDSEIRISANGKEANGKRLLSLMGLGAVKDTEITVTVEGTDEEVATEALERFCRGGMTAAYLSLGEE